jgi:hypothetical protein
MMEAVCSYETWVVNDQATQCHILENINLSYVTGYLGSYVRESINNQSYSANQ